MATHAAYISNDPINAESDQQEPPAKRLKTQACLRCRRRKQKCNDERPCANCTRASEQCVEAVSASNDRPSLVPSLTDSLPHMPLDWLGDIASLDERVSRLEENDHLSTRDRIGVESEACLNDIDQPVISNKQPQINISMHNPDLEGYLPRSSPAIGLLATFARSENESYPPHNASCTTSKPSDQENADWILSKSNEEKLFVIYREKVHCKYPFLRLDDLQDVSKRPVDHWVSYFTNMICSIGLLLGKDNQIDVSRHRHQAFYRVAVTQYLSHVFAQPERLLHIQAYLLLAMHAIYSPSTERIISISSATMRYCVMAQLHLADTEPEPLNAAAKIQIQMRRRVFWSAYALDRAVGTAFDLPFSIPDYQITVPLYASINELALSESRIEAYSEDSENRPSLTNVSFALHMVYCRQIQSEILNTTLHRDFVKHFDRQSDWRLRVLVKLDRWKSLCHRYSDSRSITGTSSEWLHMMYNYSLAMLYHPTRSTVVGPAGDWTVKSCVQACLIFRKFQRETEMSELWLGLVVQFKCGVALLYCFFATPPHLRSAAYELPEASEAIRACSIILSILAERWSQARCVRDAFDILAREIPLFEHNVSTRRMRQESSEALLALMGQLETVIVHQKTLRMIKEMAVDEPPRPPSDCQGSYSVDAEIDGATQGVDVDSPSWRTSLTGEIFQPMMPYFSGLGPDDFDYTAVGFPGEFDPQISF